LDVPKEQVDYILQSLGLIKISEDSTQGLAQYSTPSHRFDLSIEEDLIEEVARIYGYDNIPNNIPVRELNMQAAGLANLTNYNNFRKILSGLGYFEAITYSFIDGNFQDDYKNNSSNEPIKLLNPLSNDMGELRMSLVPGLLKIVDYNLSHKAESLKFYEIGKCFFKNSGELIEQPRLAGVIAGDSLPISWARANKKVDFYDLKGDIDVLFNNLGMQDKVSYLLVDKAFSGLHPGRSALIKFQNRIIGYIGVPHPKVIKKTNIASPIVLFELFLDQLDDFINQGYTKNRIVFKEISKMPIIRRDLAFLLENEVKAIDIITIVKREVGELLKSCYIFDVYQGNNIPVGYKNLAFAMFIQHESKTLVDAEINAIVDKVIDKISSKLKGELRK
jgi:phenylalanyl-tRNA synthetase beta chain